MRLSAIFLGIILLTNFRTQGQDAARVWEFEAATNFYLIPNDFFILPVLKADKDKLHLEARYNYEDRQTFSGWVGYNFKGGEKWEYAVTPMIGGIAGLTNGIAPGVEFTLARNRFELYTESEFVFDLAGKDNSYYYNWTDISYGVTDWLWVGISAQRTRLYKTKLEIQRGLLVGAAYKNWEVTGYLYNIGFDDPFGIITLALSF